MSPKFALAILLFSCVLLGIANAQQHRYPQQTQQQRFPSPVRYNQQKNGPRNLGAPETDPSNGGSDPSFMDCTPNQLASNTIDNKKPRPKH
ncbi:hypothetical protein KR084_002676 [Drosophila pseudotakahashii]|nr:hypothetical protein KR084_002676 [Drosophila pseudotakahashii]